MEFIKVLSLLPKSSPFAVSTEYDTTLVSYKDYQYIKTDIEANFEKVLLQSSGNEVVFLCGSSGDGKSKILTRFSKYYKSIKDFHLDATHSFSLHQTAIQALDEKFSEFKENNRPLIIGVNIVMFGHYSRKGSNENYDIKTFIKVFLAGNQTSENNTFLDFESYTKFYFSDGEGRSSFAEPFLEKLILAYWSHLFYKKKCGQPWWPKFATNLMQNQDKYLLGLLLLNYEARYILVVITCRDYY